MTVLVTGGAGFIGSNFLHLSVPRFGERRFVNLDKLGYASNLANLRDIAERPNYRFEHVDLADRDQVDEVFTRHEPTLVVHFAAESHVDRSIVDPHAFVHSNVVGTLHLLDAFRRHSADKPDALLHHVSTDEVYGSLGSEGLFTERSPYDPSSPYAASKAASDHFVRAYARTYDIPVKISNCSNNYGPYQFPEKLIPLMILNALAGEKLPVYGEGKNVRDWIYVLDHCEAIWQVIERGKLGATYNIGASEEHRNVDVVERICRVVAEQTHRPVDELLARIEFVADRPGHDLRYALDATKIERDCGWRPRESFESGLRKTVRWYLENTEWVEQVRSGAYREWIATNYGERAAATGGPPQS